MICFDGGKFFVFLVNVIMELFEIHSNLQGEACYVLVDCTQLSVDSVIDAGKCTFLLCVYTFTRDYPISLVITCCLIIWGRYKKMGVVFWGHKDRSRKRDAAT